MQDECIERAERSASLALLLLLLDCSHRHSRCARTSLCARTLPYLCCRLSPRVLFRTHFYIHCCCNRLPLRRRSLSLVTDTQLITAKSSLLLITRKRAYHERQYA